MKRLLFAFALTTALTAASAETKFSGIESIMTLEEFHNAGLDQLTPAQIAVINQAITKHLAGAVQTEVAKQSDDIRRAAAEEERRSILARFGLPVLDLNQEWKSDPALAATVTGWVGGNSFKLDNGQVWEGTEPITYELKGKAIRVLPRPGGQFSLEIEGKNTTIRIRRVK
ncbi:MAG: hypothetical protein IT582_09630 [Opitutaceae bacterium]|nr:hypothetical protein [Opitutaceae bacterium]